MEPLDIVASTYLACLIDVVGTYAGERPEIRVSPQSQPIPSAIDFPIATLIRCGEERMWGSSILVADADAVMTLSELEDVDPTDWLGELNNQLMGRLKNRLLCRGVMLHISQPVLVAGFVKDRRATACWDVEWSTGRLVACLGITITPGLSLDIVPEVSTAPAQEGSLCIF